MGYLNKVMTILDASIKLYAWFAEHDSFCVETDEKKLLEDYKRKKFKRKEELAAINCALSALVSMDMVSSHVVEDQIWVLKKGFETLTQTLNLSPDTCQSIAFIVSGFCDVVGNTSDRPDPKEIREADIKNLLFVCSHLMDNASPPATPPIEENPEDTTE